MQRGNNSGGGGNRDQDRERNYRRERFRPMKR